MGSSAVDLLVAPMSLAQSKPVDLSFEIVLMGVKETIPITTRRGGRTISLLLYKASLC